MNELKTALGLKVCDAPFAAVVTTATAFNWTRNPFDRLIAAQAAQQNTELLTADQNIRTNYARALWE